LVIPATIDYHSDYLTLYLSYTDSQLNYLSTYKKEDQEVNEATYGRAKDEEPLPMIFHVLNQDYIIAWTLIGSRHFLYIENSPCLLVKNKVDNKNEINIITFIFIWITNWDVEQSTNPSVMIWNQYFKK